MVVALNGVVLSDKQELAVQDIEMWFKGQHPTNKSNYYTLAGYAGTGKTTIINCIVEALGIKHNVVFATFTGKASLVLSRKLKEHTCITLHKFLYEAKRVGNQVVFVRRPKKDFRHVKLLIVDECSMVSDELENDLIASGVKILYVGDHGQLPPVGNESNVYKRLAFSPDFVLDEIHRQAGDNPIIHLSMLARTGGRIEYGLYGNDVLVIPKSEALNQYWSSVMAADQIICGKNDTRFALNARMRHAHGITDVHPVVGDKVLCTQNNWNISNGEFAMVNGLIGNITDIKHIQPDERLGYRFNVRPDFSNEEYHHIEALSQTFLEPDKKKHVVKRTDYGTFTGFEFGYALTCHKSQGSEWDKVFVYSEVLNRKDHHRWMYTAITRAAKKLIIAL